MDHRRYRRCLICILVIALAGLGFLGYEELRDGIPDSYTQTEGEPAPSYSNLFVTEEIKSGLTEASANAYASEGYTIEYKLMGLIPLKEARVEVLKPAYVIPGGVPIGIYMETEGILIIGTGEVTGVDGLTYEPAYRIVQRGDYLRAINGRAVYDKEELIEEVNAQGSEDVILDLERNGEPLQVKVEAVQTGQEEYKLGIWVRDNTQGIGTLTFLTKNGGFGALGHGVNDVDTGGLLKISEGALYDTNIIDIKKGEKGTPGELSGLIRYRQELICGQLTENTTV